jgi:HNH endonuclease/Helix-turn-helix domain of resolvase
VPVSGKAKIAMVDQSEEWVPVPGLPFEVTRTGRVRRIFQIEYIIHGVRSTSRGYPRVKCNGTTYFLHRLIAAAFLGPRPPGNQIDHKDGNKKNWLPENLEYVTPAENIRRSWRAGTRKIRPKHYGEKAPAAKLTNEQAAIIRQLANQGTSISQLARRFSLSRASIRDIVHGRSYSEAV